MLNRIKFVFLGMLLFSSKAIAFDTAPGPDHTIRQFIEFKDSIGLANYNKSDEIPDPGAQTFSNLDYSINGTLRTRRAIFNTTSNFDTTQPGVGSAAGRRVYRSFWIFNSTRSNTYFCMFEGGRNGIMYQTGVVGNQQGFIPTGQFVSPGNTDRADHYAADGYLYVASEASRLLKISEFQTFALTSTVIVGAPTGYILKPHLDRLLISGSTVPETGMTIFYSSADTFTSWPPDNFIDLISIKSDEYITGIGDAIYGNVPVYTNRSTRLLTGTEYGDELIPININVRIISESIGCIAYQTIKTLKGIQYFFSAGANGTVPGIYAFNGVTVKEKTKPYRRFFKDFVDITTGTYPTAFTYKDSYCLSVATIGMVTGSASLGPNVTICLDEDGRITGTPGTDFGPFDADINGNGYFLKNQIAGGMREDLMRYDYGDNYALDQRETTNAQTPINWDYKTKDFDLQTKNRPKTPVVLYFKHEVTTGSKIINLTVNYDFGNASTTWVIDTSTLYKTGSINTVMNSNTEALEKLSFPSGIHFNFINFDLSGSSQSTASFLDFYATPESFR